MSLSDASHELTKMTLKKLKTALKKEQLSLGLSLASLRSFLCIVLTEFWIIFLIPWCNITCNVQGITLVLSVPVLQDFVGRFCVDLNTSNTTHLSQLTWFVCSPHRQINTCLRLWCTCNRLVSLLLANVLLNSSGRWWVKTLVQRWQLWVIMCLQVSACSPYAPNILWFIINKYNDSQVINSYS